MSLPDVADSGRLQPPPERPMVAWALEYAERGLPVFPCKIDKRPHVSGGFKAASRDPAQIREWWARWPDASIAMPTGAASGMWVLDVDDEAAFRLAGITMPATRRVRTGKGSHYYFAYDPANPVGNKGRDSRRPGTDVRGDGGYVILPPSAHKSGRRYEWEDEQQAVMAPPEILALVGRATEKSGPTPSAPQVLVSPIQQGDTDLGLASLRAAAWFVETATNGTQQETLNRMAFNLSSHVKTGLLTLETARQGLIAAGQRMHSFDVEAPWTTAQIAAIVNRAFADGAMPAHKPLGEADIILLNWAELASRAPERKQFVVPELAPAGEVTLLTGAGSAGKSLLGQQLATAVASGKKTLGLDLKQAPAIYLTCEDDPQELHWRQSAICRAIGVEMADLVGSLLVGSLRGRLGNILMSKAANGEISLSPTFDLLANMVRDSGAKLVVLDNVAHLFGGNENDRGEVTQFVNALNRLAGATGAAILLVAHPNKAGDNYSGSTAWLNAVRSQVFLERDSHTNIRTLRLGKANYAAIGDPMRFVYMDGAFKLERELDPNDLQAFAEALRAKAEDEAFLHCLAACTQRNRNVSHQKGPNYAPRVFAGLADNKGLSEAAFTRAMERLVHDDRIEFDVQLWPGPNRHMKRGIRARPINRTDNGMVSCE